jgi:septum formation protein
MIYLASRSPRRRELLAQIGVKFEPLLFREGPRQDADTDEAVRPGEQPDDYVRRVTQLKSEAAWQRVVMRRGLQRKPVLAADTTVAIGGEILGKPLDRADAERILKTLSGTQHRVLTAVALQFESRFEVAVSESLVTFTPLDAERIAAYVQSGEPFARPAPMPSRGARRPSSSASRAATRRDGPAALRDLEPAETVRRRCPLTASTTGNHGNTDEHR